jgi:hypothetical protein
LISARSDSTECRSLRIAGFVFRLGGVEGEAVRMRLPLPGPCLSMELIDGGMNPVGEELPELDEQRLRSKREDGEMVGLA